MFCYFWLPEIVR